MLLMISIWQKQSRDFGENKDKRSSKKTDIKTCKFHSLKKKTRNQKISRRISRKWQFVLSNMIRGILLFSMTRVLQVLNFLG